MLIYICRRAKLKRLTADDQERMRISRALPVGFDFSQTLCPTSKEFRPVDGPALIDPLLLGAGASQRSSPRLGMGHLDLAFNSISSTFTHRSPSPVSASSFTDPSPVSSISRPSQRPSLYSSTTQCPLATSSHSPNPFGRSHSLSSDFIATHSQSQTFNQTSMIGIVCQRAPTIALPVSSLAHDTFGYGDSPPLQFSTTPLKTGEHQSLDKSQIAEGSAQTSGLELSQYLGSSVILPKAFSYDQSRMLSPSGSAFQASSYRQDQASSFRQGSQMSTQDYQYRQQSQPH